MNSQNQTYIQMVWVEDTKSEESQEKEEFIFFSTVASI